MKVPFLLSIAMLVIAQALGQNKVPQCGCPRSQYTTGQADTVFKLANGIKIALCGYREKDIIYNTRLYSEFVLSKCGTDKIIKFWSATEVCSVIVKGNFISVQHVVNLPVGKNMSYKQVVFYREDFYNGGTLGAIAFNTNIPHYTASQIKSVIKLYSNTKNENSETLSDLADKLLISAVSGSKKAAQLLLNFKEKFTNIDGHIAEEYNNTLQLYSRAIEH